MWHGHNYIFKLSGAGHKSDRFRPKKQRAGEHTVGSVASSISPKLSPQVSPRGSNGHLPVTTTRDTNTFEQVGGSELANKHLLMEIYRSGSCEYPPLGTFESTTHNQSRHELQDISLGEERSLDSAGDYKRIFLQENSITFQQKAQLKPSQDQTIDDAAARRKTGESALSNFNDNVKPNSPDFSQDPTKSLMIGSPDFSQMPTRQGVRGNTTKRNLRTQHRTDTATTSIDRRQFILSQGHPGRGLLETPGAPIMGPKNIIEKMIRNRKNISTRGYERAVSLKKRSLAIDTVTNSDIYLNSNLTLGDTGREYTQAGSVRQRRVVDMNSNNTGRSVRGCGAHGRSNSPCSHSGMDPNLPRGKSSQLNFEIIANETQIKSISRHF